MMWSRELERHPDVLVPAMPHRPDHFAAMEATLAPRPRTRKMIGMMVGPHSHVFARGWAKHR